MSNDNEQSLMKTEDSKNQIEAIQKEGFNLFEFFMMCNVCVSSIVLAICYNLNPVLKTITQSCTQTSIAFENQCIKMDGGLSGIMLGSLPFGAFIASLLCDVIQVNSKKKLIITAFIFLAGNIITYFMSHPVVLIIGRLISGIAVGFSSIYVPLYISDVSSSEKKTSYYITASTVFTVIGGLFGSLLILIFYSVETYKISFLILIGINIFHIFSLFWISSPKNNTNEENENKKCNSIFEFFKQKEAKQWLCVIFLLQFCQQSSGIGAISTILNTVFNPKELTGMIQYIALGIVTLLGSLSTMVCTKYLDYNTILIISCLFCALPMLLIGLNSSYITWVIYPYYFGYYFGLCPLVWVIASKIVRPKDQQVSFALTNAFHWLLNSASIALFSAYDQNRSLFYYYYSISTFISIYVIYKHSDKLKSIDDTAKE